MRPAKTPCSALSGGGKAGGGTHIQLQRGSNGSGKQRWHYLLSVISDVLRHAYCQATGGLLLAGKPECCPASGQTLLLVRCSRRAGALACSDLIQVGGG